MSYTCPMHPEVQRDQPGDCPKCGMSLEVAMLGRSEVKAIYTCPMHPQIEQDHAGSCPICGMALELKTPVANDREHNSELRDILRRFWIGAVLAFPVLLFGMAHLVPKAPSWI